MNLPPTPTHIPDNSQAALRALYDQQDFQDLLAKCERFNFIPRRRRKPEDTFHSELAEYEEAAKFLDPETKHTIAVIFWYTDTAGRTFETIRSIRIGDIIYDAKSHPD